jgi:hypothetical protein
LSLSFSLCLDIYIKHKLKIFHTKTSSDLNGDCRFAKREEGARIEWRRVGGRRQKPEEEKNEKQGLEFRNEG